MKLTLKLAALMLCVSLFSAGQAHATFYSGYSWDSYKSYDWSSLIKKYNDYKDNYDWDKCDDEPKWDDCKEEPKDDCDEPEDDCEVVPTPAALPAGILALAAMGLRRRREA